MKILLTEDEQITSDFIRDSLKSELFAVDVANNGEQGSHLALTNDYDLIILDLNLPKKGGIDILKDVRNRGKIVPVLVLSATTNVGTKVELLNAGADDYLNKPFSGQELLARIRALLRRPKNMEGEILALEDLVVDTRKFAVRRKDRDIYLTRKEFMLLEYLMRNHKSVLSRAMIMEHVWDMNADPFSNTIESHILNLRRKIDFPGAKKLIHTVPGRGYKLAT